jgi:hypothetical protein
MVEEASSYLSYGDRARAGGLVCTHVALWLKAEAFQLRRPRCGACPRPPPRAGLGVAGVASTSASDGDQATPATVRYTRTYRHSSNSCLDSGPARPVHEPADAMQTSLLSAQGSETVTIEAGAARLSVQGSEETKTRVEGAV